MLKILCKSRLTTRPNEFDVIKWHLDAASSIMEKNMLHDSQSTEISLHMRFGLVAAVQCRYKEILHLGLLTDS